MTFTEAVRTCLLEKYLDFSGRARRSEFWWFVLFGIIVGLVAYALDRALGFSPDSSDPEELHAAIELAFEGAGYVQQFLWSPISTLTSLALLLPSLAVAVRRLHDRGHPGAWIVVPVVVNTLLGFVPLEFGSTLFTIVSLTGLIFIPIYLLLLYWYVRDSEPGPNKYGPNPKGEGGPPTDGGTYASSRVPNVER